MTFFNQRFKVGETVYIRKPMATIRDDDVRRWVKGVITYAHPMFGWCNVSYNGITYGVWNNEILSESEYFTQREKVKSGEQSYVHIRCPSDGAVAY